MVAYLLGFLRHPNLRGLRGLIAGTSIGAIIAAGLVQGMTAVGIRQQYLALGHRVFESSFFRQGLVRAKYDESKLVNGHH